MFYRNVYAESIIAVNPLDQRSVDRLASLLQGHEARLIFAFRMNTFDQWRSIEKQKASIDKDLVRYFDSQAQSAREHGEVNRGIFPMRDRMSFAVDFMEGMAEYSVNAVPIYDLPNPQQDRREHAPAVIDLAGDDHHGDNIDDSSDSSEEESEDESGDEAENDSGDDSEDEAEDDSGDESGDDSGDEVKGKSEDESEDDSEDESEDDAKDEAKLPDYGVEIKKNVWYTSEQNFEHKKIKATKKIVKGPTAIYPKWYAMMLTLLELEFHTSRSVRKSIQHKEQAIRWVRYLMYDGAKLTTARMRSLHRIKLWRDLITKMDRSWFKLPSSYYDCSGCPWCQNDQVRVRLSNANARPYYVDQAIPPYEQFVTEFFNIPNDDWRMDQNLNRAPLPNPAAFAERIRRLRLKILAAAAVAK